MLNKRFFFAAAICLITLLLYANSLGNSFSWDDYLVVVNNDFIKSRDSIPLLLSEKYITKTKDVKYLGQKNIGSGEASYRPVATLTYFIDYSLWKLNPLGYHLVNILLHICNAILIFVLLEIITKKRILAFMASLLFALHPVNGEAVNSVSFREDPLVLFFFLFALLFYIISQAHQGKKKWSNVLLSLFFFFLALFSKETAVVLPFILILYDYLFVDEGKANNLLTYFRSRYLVYFVMLFFYLFVRFFPMNNSDYPYVEYLGGGFFTNILAVSKIVTIYIGWLIFPVNVHPTLPDESFMLQVSFFNPVTIGGLLLVAALLIRAIKTHKKAKKISFCISWFFITLIPASNILPIPNYFAARYLYIPSIGFCFFISLLLYNLKSVRIFSVSQKILRTIPGLLFLALFIFYSFITVRENLTWRNNTTLWSKMVKYYPENPLAHSNLGDALKEEGDLDGAIDEYRKALRLDFLNAEDHAELGAAYYKKGMFDNSINELKLALKLDPNMQFARRYLGAAFGEKGLYKESIRYYTEAIRINPKDQEAYHNLGITYAKMGKYNEAKKAWQKALGIKPDYKASLKSLKRLEFLEDQVYNKNVSR